jgi:hypothetical protein
MFPDLHKVFILSFFTLGAFGFLRSAMFFGQIMHGAPWFPPVALILAVMCTYVVKIWWSTLRKSFPS